MSEKMLSNKRYHLLFSFYFLLFGALVALATSLVNYNIQYTDIERQVQEKFQVERNLKQELLHRFISKAESQLIALVNSPLTQAYVRSEREEDRKLLNHLFLAASLADTDNMQVRFLGPNGHELVRVDRRHEDSHPRVFSKKELQNKSDRYYFKEASKLPSGQFWHSNLDLNIEQGKIEIPLSPTFRVAAPVFTDNRFAGLVIINLQARRLLKSIGVSTDLDIFIVDGQGEFILHPDQAKSWSRYLPDRPNLTEEFPSLAQRILSNHKVEDEGMFSFSLDGQFHNREEARMVMLPKFAMLAELKRNNLITASIIALIVVVVSFPLSWLVAIAPTRLQGRLNEAMEKINAYQRIIDKNVVTSSTDMDGRIINISTAYCDLTGYTSAELVGQTHSMVRHQETSAEFYANMWTQLTQGHVWRGEICNRAKDGQDFWLRQVITPEFGKNGVISGYTAIGTDISDKKEVERLSVTDRLTGLYNRHRLDEVLIQDFDRFQRYSQPFCIILLDIDHFKRVNDDFGHQAGDQVLVDLADILHNNSRKADTVGRWGGEEFLVICPATSRKKTMILAEKLREKIEARDFPVVGSITSSFGVAEIKNGDEVKNLISRADKSLYKAKNEGRNRVVTDG
jgi:diguanylate cyclase (GGDEF)-like protein/PAS domain S-box-containing protein